MERMKEMPLFGPSEKDFLRLERQLEKHLDKIERQLEKIGELQDEHAKRENGHPAKVVWHGMTWAQIIGLGMLVAVLVMAGSLVGFNLNELGDLGTIVETLTNESSETQSIMPFARLFFPF